ncbi:MAG: hypothetical protein QOG67_2758 [Verrucomicrobiota bacterium]|jgi:quercetin dioxygenase-like cupin family protein
MKRIAIFAAVILGLSAFVLSAGDKQSTKSAPATEHKIVTPSDLQWVDAPPGLPPGAKMAVLDGDPTKKGSFTVRLQTPSGYKIPPHTHPTAERVTVISGTIRIGMGDKFDEAAAQEMSPGSFAVMPAGMKHFASSTSESVIQLHSEGPFEIKYVNPSDDPRNAKK